MRKINRILLAAVALLVLSACAELEATPTEQIPNLRFVPMLTMYEEGKVHFEIGIVNEANQAFSGAEDVNIRAIVTNEEGKIRNQMTILDLGPIPAQDSAYPLLYEAVYDPGKYVMSLTGENIPSLSLAFEIREEDGIRKLVAHPDYIDPHTGFTISDPDLGNQ